MSRRHGWLRFQSTGHPLARRLTDDVVSWQEAIRTDHERWYGPNAPAQVSSAFVLQYLLQVLAHTAATAASTGMRVRDLSQLTFALDEGSVPRLVEIGAVAAVPGDLDEGLATAEADYRSVAEALARDYAATHPTSSRQRAGMVADMWLQAAGAVRSSAGQVSADEPRRISCCLIYALPGCSECAGCPRSS
ncbi:MAG: (2Fe-2S)-binding protein [Actinomycetia bacterium]|nr:(2Fe-2S)-binding protein [Actinomycetes bacterium]